MDDDSSMGIITEREGGEEIMEKTTWKILAIIFIVLFVSETLLIGWGMMLVLEDEEKIMECYYEICEGYPEAFYEDDLCHCYSYDMFGGELILNKTRIMR